MQILNDENDKGKTADEKEAATAGHSRHPASTRTSKHCWQSAMYGAKRWISSKNIDWLSRRIFPSTFVIFNVIYWSVYLSPPYFHCDLVAQNGVDKPCFNTSDAAAH